MPRFLVALVLLIASAITNAQVSTEPGWKVGDVYGLTTFCLSEKSGLNLMNLLNLNEGEVKIAPAGCTEFPREVPFVLVERIISMQDWENDPFELWRAREFFRKDIYVILWHRPEMLIPPILQAI